MPKDAVGVEPLLQRNLTRPPRVEGCRHFLASDRDPDGHVVWREPGHAGEPRGHRERPQQHPTTTTGRDPARLRWRDEELMPDPHLCTLAKRHEPLQHRGHPVDRHITRSKIVSGVLEQCPPRAEPPPAHRVPQKLRDSSLARVAVRVDIAEVARELGLGERLEGHCSTSAAAWAATMTSRHSSPWTIAINSTFARVQET